MPVVFDVPEEVIEENRSNYKQNGGARSEIVKPSIDDVSRVVQPDTEDVWKRRWRALDQTMENMLGDRRKVERKETLSLLLRSLRAFAKNQFEFFYEGFGFEVSKDSFLVESKQFPPEYVLKAILYQIAEDLSVIQKAWSQRLHVGQTLRDLESLAFADSLAYHALDLAKKNNLLKYGTVLTYYQKSANVRVIPYAPVALIGLPLSAKYALDEKGTPQSNVRDLLAVPHEVGHYIYKLGHVGNDTMLAFVQKLVSENPFWRYRWLEEIFADLYGAAVAGPAIALDFQELQTDNNLPHEFVEDDGEHPVPIIRPYIYIDALKKIPSKFPDAHKTMNRFWNKRLARRGDPEGFAPKNRVKNSNENGEIKRGQARTKLYDVVNQIWDNVFVNVDATWSLDDIWSGDVDGDASSATEKAIYNDFSQRISAIHKRTRPANLVAYEENQFQIKEVAESRRTIGETGSWVDDVRKTARNGRKMPTNLWEVVFSANGWATRGPQGNPTGV